MKVLSVHRSWVMVAVAFLVMSTYGIFFSYGVFFKPMMDEFGWTRADTSTAFTVYMIVYTFSSIPMGVLFDRYGPRVPLYVAAVTIGLGFSLCSQVTQLWQLWLLFGLVGGFGFGAIYVVPVATVVMWFKEKRGMAAGLAVAGIGGGIAAMPLVAERIVSASGWRVAFVALGLGYAAWLMVAASVIRKQPEDVGLRPFGADSGHRSVGGGREQETAPQARPDLTVKQALGTRSFWMLYASMAIAFAAETLSLVHVVPFAEDMGMTAAVAAGGVTLIGLGSIAGRVTMGAFSDRLGRRSVMAFSYFLEGASLLSLVWVSDVVSLYTVSFIIGVSFGGFSSVFAPLVSEYFGLKHMGKILAAAFSNGAPAGVAGPLLAGYIFDVSGSYRLAFIVCSAMCFAAVICALLIRSEIARPLALRRAKAQAA